MNLILLLSEMVFLWHAVDYHLSFTTAAESPAIEGLGINSFSWVQLSTGVVSLSCCVVVTLAPFHMYKSLTPLNLHSPFIMRSLPPLDCVCGCCVPCKVCSAK